MNRTHTHSRAITRNHRCALSDTSMRACSMLKDDGPKQLKEAFLVLIGVAGSIICCGVLMVLGMWMNREKVYFLF